MKFMFMQEEKYSAWVALKKLAADEKYSPWYS